MEKLQSRSILCLMGWLFYFTGPTHALAHVKWFVRDSADHQGPVEYFSLSEPWVQIWMGVILACVVVALVLDRCLPGPPQKLLTLGESRRPQILHLFQLLVGVALLVTAVKGAIMAPHLEEAGGGGLLLRFVEGGIGVLFIANVGVRLGAALLVVLFLASAGIFGFVTSLEYFNFLGIAVFLFAQRASNQHVRDYALPMLRLHSGIALGVLAWTEKLSNPSLAMQFLEKNQINFMKMLGEDMFTDRFFVLCAGCTEMIFALIFALGLITRINTLALAGFLVSSNLYFFLVGKTAEAFLELTGHLPLIAIAIILIFYGSGKKLKLTNVLFRPGKTAQEATPTLGNHPR